MALCPHGRRQQDQGLRHPFRSRSRAAAERRAAWRDIRHEITLDTSSSGGLADLVVVLPRAAGGPILTGIEIKNASDTLMRCVEQLDAYGHAFDISALDQQNHRLRCDASFHFPEQARFGYSDEDQPRAESALWRRLHEPYRSSQETRVVAISRLLWQSEVETVLQRKTTRIDGLNWIRENLAMKDLRPGVIGALRTRVLNKWEEAFRTWFDAEPAALERAA